MSVMDVGLAFILHDAMDKHVFTPSVSFNFDFLAHSQKFGNLRELAISLKLYFPGGFHIFDQLCYRHVYIFGISKNAKKFNFFPRPHGGECKSENVDFGQLKSIFWPWARKAK